jgi:biotin carboxyl carrier protein
VRRYTLEVSGKAHVIDVEELSADRFRVFLEDRELVVRLSSSEDLAEAVISPAIAPPHAPPLPYRPAAPETLEPVPRLAPPALPPQPHLPEDGFRPELCAPMPGTVVSVQASAGEAVQHGQVLLKLEAMKMTNAIKSPQDAVVGEVRVAPGQSVGYGDVLLTFREK